ncbi:MAG: hypothetical protein NDJ89_12955 [Oligoflexia bacterium]|nr:hypothetical protein [Oligoflexia bacterium]
MWSRLNPEQIGIKAVGRYPCPFLFQLFSERALLVFLLLPLFLGAFAISLRLSRGTWSAHDFILEIFLGLLESGGQASCRT